MGPNFHCDAIDKTARGFLWNSKSGGKGIHLVRWDMVTDSKHNGGLSIRSARENNIAMMGKLCGDLVSKSEKLWVSILSAKYLGNNFLFNHSPLSSALPLWNGICKSFSFLRDGFR